MEAKKKRVYKLASEIVNEMRKDGTWNRKKDSQMVDLAEELGMMICYDDDYIAVEDEVFYINDPE